MGFVLIVIGLGFLVNGVLTQPVSALQQTIQYLSYVCFSIFFCSGFIYLKIPSDKKDQKIKEEKKL